MKSWWMIWKTSRCGYGGQGQSDRTAANREFAISALLGGRSVFDDKKKVRPGMLSKQLSLF